MKWITALTLQQWAATLQAREIFPALIGDLNRASASEINSYRFPNGDKSQVRGFDGWLEAGGTPPFVPEGRSIWEFGVAGSDAAKAASDFRKRTNQVDEAVQRETTFVFASPDSWDNPKLKIQDWQVARKNESAWKDVRYLDGSQIEDWLLLCPAVAAQYASEMGARPQDGARGIGEFWNEFAHRFKSKLSEEVLLAGREAKAAEFLQQLLGSVGPIELAADSPDEVIAFAIAAIRKADATTRTFLENRTLILDDERAARFFANSKNLIFFPRSQATAASGLLASKGATLISKGRDQTARKGIFLDRPSTTAFAKALETMGLNDEEAHQLAIRSARSIAVLARQYPGGNFVPPAWINDGNRFLPALLAGSWDAANERDQEILQELIADKDYHTFEGTLRRLSKLQDPPVDIEGSFWKIRAPVDAFIHLAHLIGGEDLNRLKTVATRIFTDLDTSPDPDAPFNSSNLNIKRYSSWLRDGVANTLLQIAVLSKQSDFNVPGTEPQRWVEEVVAALPGLDTNHQVLACMRSELWTLMEAAPRPLLSALEQLLKGDGEAAKGLFSTNDEMFAPTSPHIYVLWALETLAWDPSHLLRVSLILAKLATIDPGGQVSNRPINSLRSILVPWSPNTNAGLEQRRRVLSRIIEACPTVGWELSLLMLPRAHDSNDVHQKPMFREAGASQAEVLTNAKVWDGQEFVVDTVLDLVGDDPLRWIEVINHFYNWTPRQRARAISELDKWLASTVDSKPVWLALNALANKHVAFADTDWALPKDDISTLRLMLEKYAPDDIVERSTWLFDRWSPQMAVRFEENDEQLQSARSTAVLQVLALPDVGELLRLVDLANEPATVAVSAGHSFSSVEEFLTWISVAVIHGTSAGMAFCRVMNAIAEQRFGETWRDAFKIAAEKEAWSSNTIGHLLLNWPDTPDTWNYVGALGETVRTVYWKEKIPFSLDVQLEDAFVAVENYLSVGRAEAAMKASHRIVRSLPTPLLIRMMKDYVIELNIADAAPDQMAEYYVEHLFAALDQKDDISEAELAGLEYSYLPLLERKPRQLVIHKLMSRSPEFFISLLQSVFLPANAERQDMVEVTAAQKSKARNDYKLLHNFDVLPGKNDEGIEFNVLKEWVQRVRQLAQDCDRVTIADIYIGHILAHAPNEADGTWPPVSVRRLIDLIQSEDVERGVATERFNMRGVYSKSMDEGGAQERGLATSYRMWSKASAEYPSTRLLLERIAESYERDAQREDERAAIRKLQN